MIINVDLWAALISAGVFTSLYLEHGNPAAAGIAVSCALYVLMPFIPDK